MVDTMVHTLFLNLLSNPIYIHYFQVEGEVVIAEPYHACTDLVNEKELKGKIALMVRGECMFVDKVSAVSVLLVYYLLNLRHKTHTLQFCKCCYFSERAICCVYKEADIAYTHTCHNPNFLK